MDKRQLVAAAARRSTLTRSQVREALDAIFGTITEALASGDNVVLRDFGRFSTWKRRQRIHDFGGQSHTVEQAQLVFKASETLRRQLREKQ